MKTPVWSRRRFIKQTGRSVIAAGIMGSPVWPAHAPPETRRVVVMSDIHIGKTAQGVDGSEWLARAFSEMSHNIGPLSYGLTLGDITHHGDRYSLKKYLTLRDKSSVSQWYDLAGNHEYRHGNIKAYQHLVGTTEPQSIIDGNITWLLISDENDMPPGIISAKNLRWLKQKVDQHKNQIIIVCSHQIPANTVRRSDEDIFCLYPQREVTDLLSDSPIVLSLFGHEHHDPYSKNSRARKNGTTFINAASVTHAYGTGASGSVILEMRNGDNKIVVRRRNHDRRKFQKEFEVVIPLTKPINLSKPSVASVSEVAKVVPVGRLPQPV